MEDELVFKMFIELAVLEGKRRHSGEWMITDAQELPRLLKRAHQIVSRARAGFDDELGRRGRPAVALAAG